jgi:putative glycosyltransferase
MKLSIVTTLYYSAAFLQEFYTRASKTAKEMTDDYEIIFVNDGSPDNSIEIVVNLFARDAHVRVIDLSRNFGHHKAIMTGLAHAKGDLIFLLDSDLEEKVEWLELFDGEMKKTGADVVYGVQQKRKGDWFERITGEAFYSLFNLLSDIPVPRNVVTARLMTRRYVANLVEHRDREVFLLGLWTLTGFKQVPLTVMKHSRNKTTYDLGRRITILLNAVTSFTNRPLILIFYLGVVISIIAGIAAAALVLRRVFFGVLLAGWPSLIVSVWLLGGLMILCIGIIGIYLSKIFIETKERPYTVIRQIYNHSQDEQGI